MRTNISNNMKRKAPKFLATVVGTTASLMFVLSATAADTTISITEMPAQAAHQVADAKASQRADITKAVVVKAMAQKSVIAPALVGAIAKSSPEMAAVAAVTAVQQDSKQIGEITVAAVSAAPAQAGKIVAAICEKFPTKFNLVAMAAHQAAPQADKEILAAVSASVPAVKPFIAQATSSSFSGVIGEVQNLVAITSKNLGVTPDNFLAQNNTTAATPSYVPLAAGPIVGPPANNPGGTPVIVTPTSTGVVTPGTGRNYGGG